MSFSFCHSGPSGRCQVWAGTEGLWESSSSSPGSLTCILHSYCSHLITNSVILTRCAGWCYLPHLGVKWIHYKSLKCIDHVICFLFLLSVQGKKKKDSGKNVTENVLLLMALLSRYRNWENDWYWWNYCNVLCPRSGMMCAWQVCQERSISNGALDSSICSWITLFLWVVPIEKAETWTRQEW